MYITQPLNILEHIDLWSVIDTKTGKPWTYGGNLNYTGEEVEAGSDEGAFFTEAWGAMVANQLNAAESQGFIGVGLISAIDVLVERSNKQAQEIK